MVGGEVVEGGLERGVGLARIGGESVAAEKALSAEIGGREAVVFLAPMGAYDATGFEA